MKKFDICVIGGGGHVGLPLSIAFAEKGKKVIIYDTNHETMEIIKKGRMPFMEEGCEEILEKVINNNLFTTDRPECISESDIVVVVIGTPVDEHLNPKFRLMKKFFEDILPYLREEQIIILRSTIYPGTTEKIRNFLKKHISKIEVCFCPERIAEGKSREELQSLPQIVSGFTKEAVNKVSNLFNLLTDDVIVLNPIEAEITKLLTNSYRYIHFAISNQFYMICKEYGVDFDRVYHGMTYRYPRLKGFPRPGLTAGPCLFKDTMQISAFTNNKFFLGHSAMLINEGLPNFLVEQLKKKFNLQEKNAGILGMAFKSDIDDNRESLSYKLKKILEIEAKDVFTSDPYVKDEELIPEEELISKSDIIIVGVPHKRYKDIDVKDKVVVDIWGHIENIKNRF
ncbi:MAG: nucleotide sugar dehydrogenase [Candidatus Eremiobacterota bacterium]